MRNFEAASRIVWNQGGRDIHADDLCDSVDVQHKVEVAEYGSMTKKYAGIGAFSRVEDMPRESSHDCDELCNPSAQVWAFNKNGRNVCQRSQGDNGERAGLKRCDQRLVRR